MWAQSLGRQDALSELRALLKPRWAGRREERTSNALNWEAGEFERAIGRVLPRAALEARLLDLGGIAWKLEAVISSGKPWQRVLDVKAVLGVGAA
jgi:hypothetical protein